MGYSPTVHLPYGFSGIDPPRICPEARPCLPATASLPWPKPSLIRQPERPIEVIGEGVGEGAGDAISARLQGEFGGERWVSKQWQGGRAFDAVSRVGRAGDPQARRTIIE